MNLELMGLRAALTALTMLGAMPALAQEIGHTGSVPPPSAECIAQIQANAALSKNDEDVVKSANLDLGKGGYALLPPHLPDLQLVLDHAPKTTRTTWCDGSTVVYVFGADAGLGTLLEAALSQKANSASGMTRTVSGRHYTLASLMLGEWYVEQRDYRRALELLGRGLALAPTDPLLTSETANALNQTGGQTEAIAICDYTLSNAANLQPADRGRVLRAKGYALGDLGRLDEAIATYQQSLTYQPNHPGALNEIAYLNKRKAGAASTVGKSFTTKQAADPATFGKTAPVPPPPKP